MKHGVCIKLVYSYHLWCDQAIIINIKLTINFHVKFNVLNHTWNNLTSHLDSFVAVFFNRWSSRCGIQRVKKTTTA